MRSYTIYANDQLTAADKWNDVIIAYRNGAPLRVRDIGRAVSGPEDAKKAAWSSGKRGVFLIVFKQPGANVIETVDRIKAELPRLRAAMPPTFKVEILSDRTQTIRASVEDVQFTLLLTIGLVVAVIFVFLRTFWATVIPSVTVPLSLLGACGLMYLMSYSLDNISLMALTISVGFVVDDAIVMLENIVRHVEDGMQPYEAAIRVRRDRLHDPVDQHIAGGRVHSAPAAGRYHRSPVSRVRRHDRHVHRRVGVCRADVDANDGLALSAQRERNQAWAVLRDHRAWLRPVAAHLRAGLDFVLRHQFATLCVFLATLAVTGCLFVSIPKGFFPQQDTGLITGMSEAAQDVSFAEMMRRQQALGEIIAKDPAGLGR